MEKIGRKWILIGALVLLVFLMKGTTKKEDVAAIEGQPCLEDDDCPCWGEYNYTTSLGEEATAYGIGVARCKKPYGAAETTEGTCDITYCFDVEEAGIWMRDKPWEYLKENPLFTVLILGLLVWVTFFWPKI